jgi:hypothetical protein
MRNQACPFLVILLLDRTDSLLPSWVLIHAKRASSWEQSAPSAQKHGVYKRVANLSH